MKVLRRLVLFLLLMAIVAGAAVWWVWRKANEATATGEGAPRVVLVPTGGDLAGLVDTLQAQGLVEDETLSCGTGVTAAALSYLDSSADANGVAVKAPGGELRVEARPLGDGGFDHVFLSGPVRHVFTGEWQGTR